MALLSRRFGLAAAFGAGLVASLAAPVFAQAPAAAPVRGGALTIGVESDFEGFDPVRAVLNLNERIFDLCLHNHHGRVVLQRAGIDRQRTQRTDHQ